MDLYKRKKAEVNVRHIMSNFMAIFIQVFSPGKFVTTVSMVARLRVFARLPYHTYMYMYVYCILYLLWAELCNHAIYDVTWGGEGVLLTVLTPPHFCTCPNHWPGFPTSYVLVFFCVQWVNLRDYRYSFCWYRRNCWPLLFNMFKLSFHNNVDLNVMLNTTTFRQRHT